MPGEHRLNPSLSLVAPSSVFFFSHLMLLGAVRRYQSQVVIFFFPFLATAITLQLRVEYGFSDTSLLETVF